MAARRPSWRGHLKLSLVTCPVSLFSATNPAGDVHFHLINPKTGHRIRMETVDASSGRKLERKGLVKGFEISKGKFVILTAEEIDAVKLESTKTIDIENFVPVEEIDRLYWDHPYFLVPDGKLAAEPFAVIRAAMEKEGQIGLGRVVISDRERLLALEPREGIIVATTLRSHDEVRDLGAVAPDSKGRAPADMVAIATKIMKQKAAHFDPKKFDDRYEDALRALIKRKQKGEDVLDVEEANDDDSNVVSLMDALQASLKSKAKRAPKRAAASHAKRAPRKTARKARHG